VFRSAKLMWVLGTPKNLPPFCIIFLIEALGFDALTLLLYTALKLLSSEQWLKCKIRGVGERYIQVGPLTMVVCLSLAL